MKLSTKVLIAVGAALAALALGGPASANGRPRQSIVVRATAVPTFSGPSADCPAFSAREDAVSPRGAWFEFCASTDAIDPVKGDVITGIATFHLFGGTIDATLLLKEVPTSTGVVQTDTGTIFRGTGLYLGATGSFSGGGPISFDPDGTPHPNLSFTLSLGGRAIPFQATDTAQAVVVAQNGSVVQTSDTGSGRANLLGPFKLVAGERVDLASGAVADGSFTLKGLGRNSISGTYSGQALPGLKGYLVSGPITGGTGLFAGARGFLVWRGTGDPSTFVFSDVVSGWISLGHDDDRALAAFSTSSRAAVPASLAGSWGKTMSAAAWHKHNIWYEVPGHWAIAIGKKGVTGIFTPPGETDLTPLTTMHVSAATGSVAFGPTADGFCTAKANYTWKVSGGRLSFQVVNDSCSARQILLTAGSWSRI
jgi:hypothetical protein